MTETNPAAARFQLVPISMTALPAKCAVCGSVERDVVDFSMSVEDYGAVLLCISCVAAAAQLIKYVSSENVEKVEAEKELILKNLTSAVAVLREFVGELNESISDAISDVDSALTGSSVQPDLDFENAKVFSIDN